MPTALQLPAFRPASSTLSRSTRSSVLSGRCDAFARRGGAAARASIRSAQGPRRSHDALRACGRARAGAPNRSRPGAMLAPAAARLATRRDPLRLCRAWRPGNRQSSPCAACQGAGTVANGQALHAQAIDRPGRRLGDRCAGHAGRVAARPWQAPTPAKLGAAGCTGWTVQRISNGGKQPTGAPPDDVASPRAPGRLRGAAGPTGDRPGPHMATRC